MSLVKRLRKRLRKRLQNARLAFHPGEANYQLAIGEFGGFTIAYREGTADERVLGRSFDNDFFFAGVPEYRPKENDVVLDIGAHIGTFSLLAASKSPQGRIHAIEASRETFNYLKINTALNAASNIRPHQLALADRDGEIVLHHGRRNWGHSITKARSPRGEVACAMTMASFFFANNITHVDFAKFNCEGAEFPILMTTPPDVLRHIRLLMVLYHLDLVEGYTRDGLISHLRGAGFSIATRNESNRRGWLVATRGDDL